jgi:hypothetical protein
MAQQAVGIQNETIQSKRDELIDRMGRAVSGDGVREVMPGIVLARSSKLTEHVHSVFTPAFCVIAQGSKEVLLGDEVFRYDSGHYLISTVDLPIVSHVVEASPERPYFSFRLNLEPTVVASVMMEAEIKIRKGDASVKAMDVSPVDTTMLDAVVRLVRLIDTPE